MSRRPFPGPGLLMVLLSLSAVAPAVAGAHDDLRAPVFLRAKEQHQVEGGRFLLHAGNEGPARVDLVGAAGGPRTVGSSGHWALHDYAIPDDGSAVRVEAASSVWLVPVVERVVTEREVAIACSDVATHLFWSVESEEVRLTRDALEAPRVRFFLPSPGQVVPDEPSVREHTVLLEPSHSPLYLEVVQVGESCTGSLILDAGRPPGASPLAEPLDDLFWALFVAALVLGGVFSAIWWVGLRRDRRRRRSAAVM